MSEPQNDKNITLPKSLELFKNQLLNSSISLQIYVGEIKFRKIPQQFLL